jgi:hypothetical protein
MPQMRSPARVSTISPWAWPSGVRVAQVAAEGGLAVRAGGDEPGLPGSGAERDGVQEVCHRVAAAVLEWQWRHGEPGVVGKQGDDGLNVAASTVIPRMAAVSAARNPSTSRSTGPARCRGGRCCRAVTKASDTDSRASWAAAPPAPRGGRSPQPAVPPATGPRRTSPAESARPISGRSTAPVRRISPRSGVGSRRRHSGSTGVR